MTNIPDKDKKSLMLDRRFYPIFWTQFLGAFNDNVFKNALVILITFKAYNLGGLSPEQMVAACGGIFILPFFLFSSTAGQFADKVSKSRLVFFVKVWEILAMLMGTIGFINHDINLLIFTLFMMGLHSAFFGPVKYSILPELLHEDEIVTGTAYFQLGTMIAILLGTILGGVLIVMDNGSILVSSTVISVAILGTLTSTLVRKLDPVAKEVQIDPNFFRSTWHILKIAKRTESVFLSILAISWFWFLGAAVLSIIPPFVKNFLGAEAKVATFFLALFSIGVGTGSMLCERMSFKKLELGLVPIGSIGMTLFLFDLNFARIPDFAGTAGVPLLLGEFLSHWQGWRIVADLFLFSVFSGFFIVPLYALMQLRSSREIRSRTIAGNNILNALFMVVSAVYLMVLYGQQFAIPQIFLTLCLLNAAVGIYVYTVLPEFLYRFLCWVLGNVVYRLKVVNRHLIPNEGAALIVCNHVTFIDWLIISCSSHRPMRFVMDYNFYTLPVANKICRDSKVIPITNSHDRPEIMEEAFRRIREDLLAGELVCVFPEGKITYDGKINTFKKGVERVLSETPVPVIPMGLDGFWGSFFSRKFGKPMAARPRRFWSRIILTVGETIPAQKANAEYLQKTVQGLIKNS